MEEGGNFAGWELFHILMCWWLHNCMPGPKCIQLYTENVKILLYVNNTSILKTKQNCAYENKTNKQTKTLQATYGPQLLTSGLRREILFSLSLRKYKRWQEVIYQPPQGWAQVKWWSLWSSPSVLLPQVQNASMLPPGCSAPLARAPCSHLVLRKQLQNFPSLQPSSQPPLLRGCLSVLWASWRQILPG